MKEQHEEFLGYVCTPPTAKTIFSADGVNLENIVYLCDLDANNKCRHCGCVYLERVPKASASDAQNVGFSSE